MIYEIRNYHFRPDLLEDYKTWAKTQAVPYLSRKMDVLGFWASTDDAPEVNGETQDKLGSANVTWVIRWRDLAHRNQQLPIVLSGPEWEGIFTHVPGGRASYLRTEAKFAESLA
jgi:hypothetical protein